MKPLKENISITIDGQLLAWARYAADRDERSVSSVINLAVRECLKRREAEDAEASEQPRK